MNELKEIVDHVFDSGKKVVHSIIDLVEGLTNLDDKDKEDSSNDKE
jgi:hypothetical protein